MLREGHLRLVLSSLLGSIFVNLLFILGLAIMAGGFKHKDQKYNKKMTQLLIYFMNMGVLSVLIPVLFNPYITLNVVQDLTKTYRLHYMLRSSTLNRPIR
jgi:Ca2+:H+ antiporter